MLLNGKLIDHLDPTGNNKATTQAFTLANDDLISGTNTLEFVNKNATWIWGIDQVALETAGASFDEIINVGGGSSSKYGNKWSGLTDPDGSVAFGFEVSDTSNDLNLSLNAFDVDFTDEVKIVLNGKTIDHLDLTGNNATTAQAFTLANDDLISGTNTLEFVTQNAAWIWGIDQVTLA